jgi:hypothetical protein
MPAADPLSPFALVLLAERALPDPAGLVQALHARGIPVSGTRPGEGDLRLTWVTDDGPQVAALEVRAGRPALPSLPAYTSPDPEAVDAAVAHLVITLEGRAPERLDVDAELARVVDAVLPAVPAIGAHLGHLRTWHTPAAWADLLAATPEGEWPSAVMVDLSIGRVSLEAVGVLSVGLERYDHDEVFLVGDEERLADLWDLARRVVHATLMMEDTPVDLHAGPHPSRPGETVDVGFLDE